jgi:uncharacterized membrane protein
VLVLALVAIGGPGRWASAGPRPPRWRSGSSGATRRGNALFVPALIIPLVAVGGTLAAKYTGAGVAG